MTTRAVEVVRLQSLKLGTALFLPPKLFVHPEEKPEKIQRFVARSVARRPEK